MKKAIRMVLTTSILLLIGGQAVLAQNVSEETKAAAVVSKPRDVGNKICPVTGEKIDEKTRVTYEYEGRIYHFCCPGCIDEFKKDPQEYIKKIKEQASAEPEKKDMN